MHFGGFDEKVEWAGGVRNEISFRVTFLHIATRSQLEKASKLECFVLSFVWKPECGNLNLYKLRDGARGGVGLKHSSNAFFTRRTPVFMQMLSCQGINHGGICASFCARRNDFQIRCRSDVACSRIFLGEAGRGRRAFTTYLPSSQSLMPSAESISSFFLFLRFSVKLPSSRSARYSLWPYRANADGGNANFRA